MAVDIVIGAQRGDEGNLQDKIAYVIGSLKNREKILPLTEKLRKIGFKEVFEDWISPGPEADDFWRDYEKKRGKNYGEALKGWAGTHIYEFDKFHIDRSHIGIMCMPCGKSGHLELGYILGSGKRGYILFDGEPERWDVMYQFADGVYFEYNDLEKELVENGWKPTERYNFSNIFTLFHTIREQGASISEAKKLVKERIKEMWEGFGKTEKTAFQSKYASAIELLK